MKNVLPNFVLAIFLFMNFGCDKGEEVSCVDDCSDTYLKQNGMVRYKGEELDCKDFLSLYEYQNKQYYVLGNNCADIAINPTDCDGNSLCKSGDSKSCSTFFENAKYIGIVGIEN